MSVLCYFRTSPEPTFNLFPIAVLHQRCRTWCDGIKAYATLTKSRLASAPDIPTVDEAGLPGFYFSAWYALWAPKATPRSVISRLNSAVVQALADAKVRASLAGQGMEIYPPEQQTPEALSALQKAEIEKWWPIIKAANLKVE
jgi:tripartite-type tricarboxylate transporter receptor subunit TctC